MPQAMSNIINLLQNKQSICDFTVDLLDIFTMFFTLRTHEFNWLERFLISFSLIKLEDKYYDKNTFLLTKYFIIREESSIFNYIYYVTILVSNDITDNFAHLFKSILEEYKQVFYLLSVSCLCLLAQGLMFLKCRKSDEMSVNIRRKVFHLFSFFVFYNPTKLKIRLSECLFLILLLTCNLKKFRSLFSSFLSKNDDRKFLVSHVYLLGGCCFPYYFLNTHEYHLTLISICVLDSLASIIGIYLCKNKKSKEGSAGAIFFSILFTVIFLGHADVFYFIFIAFIEYIDLANDNISIPFFSICYFYFLSNMHEKTGSFIFCIKNLFYFFINKIKIF